jgi:hypothetical protein
MKKAKTTFLAASVVIVGASLSQGAISIGSLNSAVSQDFDVLATTGSSTFVDDSTIAGWTVNSEEMDSNSNEYFASSGTSTGGEVFSFGTGTDSDRALGYIGSGGNDFFNVAVGLQNNTGVTISAINVSYTGEQWRSGGNTSDNLNLLTFSYQIFSAGAGILPASTSLTGWTTVSSLDFAAPQLSLAAGSLDGNSAANQESFSGVSLGSITLNAGDEIWLRWTGNNAAGTDAGLSIDDFSAVAVPEPSSSALLGLGGLALILRRRK